MAGDVVAAVVRIVVVSSKPEYTRLAHHYLTLIRKCADFSKKEGIEKHKRRNRDKHACACARRRIHTHAYTHTHTH